LETLTPAAASVFVMMVNGLKESFAGRLTRKADRM
jgi:hypothetical protein